MSILKSQNIIVFLRWGLVLSKYGATKHKIWMGTQCWATKPCCRYQKHIILKSAKTTSKLHFCQHFWFDTFLQMKPSIMPSSYSSSSPLNSLIILDSGTSTIVISDSDSDHDSDSVTSSIFGFTCQICELRAKSATQLEYKYLEHDLPLLDSDGVHRAKCDACGASGHLVCW